MRIMNPLLWWFKECCGGANFPRNVNTDWVTPHLLTHPSLSHFHIFPLFLPALSPYPPLLSLLLSLNHSPFTVSPVLPLLTSSSSFSPSLPLSFMLCLPPAISGPHAGQVVPHPERLITFLPPAVYTSVLAATPIHYLPWSRAAHSSPLSATASFSV